jgi:hypothetical protein
MTKKDFELIASVIKKTGDLYGTEGDRALFLGIIAEELADELAKTNDRFNAELFLEKCGTHE